MRARGALPFLMVGALALIGCKPQADTTNTTTQTDTKQVGTTSESTTQTKTDTAAGSTTSVTNSYLGTVTQFTPGKSIEVMTGNKETHSLALDGKKDVLLIDPAVAVGSKVQLVEQKGEQGARTIKVTIAQAS